MVYLLSFIGWALAGWCGTRGPRPRPEPLPGPMQVFIMGALGGMAGGFLYTFAFSLKMPLSSIEYAASCIGAFVVGFVVEELTFQITKK